MSKSKKVLANVGVFVLIAALVYLMGMALLAAWPMWSAMMNGGMMGGSGWLGALFMLVFWGGLVALVAWLLVSLFRGDRVKEGSGASRDAAEETLRERFARGEISAGEYEESLEVLRSRGESRPGSPENGDAGSSGSRSFVADPERDAHGFAENPSSSEDRRGARGDA